MIGSIAGIGRTARTGWSDLVRAGAVRRAFLRVDLRNRDGTEQRKPHPAVLLAGQRGPIFEEDLNRHADVDLFDGNVNDIGNQPHIGFLGQRDHRDDVGRFEAGNPRLPIIGVGGNGGSA